MKLLFLIIIFIIFNSCSFDNKSGIWENENLLSQSNKSQFGDFKKLSISQEEFKETISLDKSAKFNLSNPIENIEWNDVFYSPSNSLENFSYGNKNKIIYLSKKLSRNKLGKNLLFEKDFYITSDFSGNIIIISHKNKILKKFNFYKKKYKKIKKKLNIIINNNVVYVTDNLGYLYAYNYKEDKIIWAKNYKIPFRSNLKIFKNKLIAADQNNNLIFFDKINGNILKLLPTEESILKNNFRNSLSLNEDNLFFLNTFGSLYSINLENMDIIWFINLNQSVDNTPSKLFSGNQIVFKNNKVLLSSNYNTYIIDVNNGSILGKQYFSSKLRPIILDDKAFFLTNNDFLVCIDINNNNILYSYDLNQKVADFINSKKKKLAIQSIFIINNEILVFLENAYFLKFKIDGNLTELAKLPSKINSYPILIEKSIIFTNNKNKLVIIN